MNDDYKFYDSKKNLIALFIICFTFVFLIRYCESRKVKADNTALHLTQCIISECDQCSKYPQEKRAMAFVLVKRARQYRKNTGKSLSLDDQILSYCAVFDKRSHRYYSARAKNIRESNFDKPLHGKKKLWRKLELWSKRFIKNPTSFKDPTPKAMNWGGDMDTERALRAGWILVARYTNNFWSYGKK